MVRAFALMQFVLFVAALTSCGPAVDVAAPQAATGGREPPLRVVATTTIVADVVAHIGGDAIELSVLLPPNGDPHMFEPTPQDVAAVADAGIVFANGVGLEVFLDALLENAGGGEVVFLSEGIELIESQGNHAQGLENEHDSDDPHVWFDPNNVIVWTQNIEGALSRLDPANAATYASNAEAYRADLQELHAWIEAQVAQVPESDRKLVTDHDSFGYFVGRYGFKFVGAIIPGYSTVSEPSAQEIAALQDAVQELDAKAVFVGITVNPTLAERITEDTGIQLVPLYTGSLSEPNGPANSYINLMRYNVTAIVETLK